VRVEVTEIIKDLKIKKKLFLVFYWPWAEFLPTGPAEPTPASLARGPTPIVSNTAPSHHRDGNIADQNLNETSRNIESQSNWKAPRQSHTRARDYHPETPINRG
jgi:hypothetical protein